MERSKCHFDIAAFPCNQFGLQEPGDNGEILNCIKYIRPGNGYIPYFTIHGKIDVNGDNQHTLYSYLKDLCPSPTGVIGNQYTYLWKLMRNDDISWNFEKFLIDHNGKPYKRFIPDADPTEMENDILSLIKSCMKE